MIVSFSPLWSSDQCAIDYSLLINIANYYIYIYIYILWKLGMQILLLLSVIKDWYIYIYIYIDNIKLVVKLATVVEGDLKAPFSIAITSRCRGGRYSFPGLLHFTLDAYLIMLSVKQGSIKYHFFESLVWLDLGLNPGLLDNWWTLYSLGQFGLMIT